MLKVCKLFVNTFSARGINTYFLRHKEFLKFILYRHDIDDIYPYLSIHGNVRNESEQLY